VAGVIQTLGEALNRSPGVSLLDSSSDPSHNRSVFTLIGTAHALKEALMTLYALAIERIDLRTHRGEHPRIGAVDVVPFVPLQDATFEDCIALARELGQHVAERFSLPVYLYEAAALRPERSSLDAIRRGQFEGLRTKLVQPGWDPDFGPTVPHPSAGATVIGARGLLIAYNVNLDTDEIDVARQIAAAVRASSGGLRHVKAMGVDLVHRRIVQVSINLTNYEETALHKVFEAVKREADRRGVSVVDSEIVGIAPARALIEAGVRYLQLEGFRLEQVLERRLSRLVLPPPPSS
jgi:glutamate formiminotransferase